MGEPYICSLPPHSTPKHKKTQQKNTMNREVLGIMILNRSLYKKETSIQFSLEILNYFLYFSNKYCQILYLNNFSNKCLYKHFY